MQYLGSKARIAKEILPIILKDRQPNQYYVEPFVGGCNIIDKVDGLRIGNDINHYLIALFKALQNGWIPPTDITRDFYNEVNRNKDKYSLELVAFLGFLVSFGGKWFGGFAHNKSNKNYSLSGSKALLKQIKNLMDVDFHNVEYWNLEIPPKSIIYCDPPYKGTTGYKDGFNHDKFYDWLREKHKEGHTIYISEYSMPDDFVCIWSKKIRCRLNKNSTTDFKIENLYCLK